MVGNSGNWSIKAYGFTHICLSLEHGIGRKQLSPNIPRGKVMLNHVKRVSYMVSTPKTGHIYAVKAKFLTSLRRDYIPLN